MSIIVLEKKKEMINKIALDYDYDKSNTCMHHF